MKSTDAPAKPFLSDVTALRERARKHLADGAVTAAYTGDVKQTIAILQTVLVSRQIQ
jgi:bacterioferritin